jgi:hypothetical protein
MITIGRRGGSGVSAADLRLAAYGQDDPLDAPSGSVGRVPSMVEVARYWNRRDAGMTRIPIDVEVAEARAAQRLSVILELVGEVSSPLAPLEVLQVGTDVWTAKALTRLGFRVETSTVDPVMMTGAALFDLVLAPDALLPLDDAQWLAATVNLSSLVRMGGRLVTGGAADETVRGHDVVHRGAAEYGAVLEPRGFRLDRVQALDASGSALLAWTRES